MKRRQQSALNLKANSADVYTKQEVDHSILSYLKSGKPIPSAAKQLSELNLPSSSTILRFYDNWKEPFFIFQKMINITSKQ